MNIITNAWRDLRSVFPPGWFPSNKHDHYTDYGWPENVTFEMLHAMYRRNGLAKAAAKKTMLRTWETLPKFWESNEPAESDTEAAFRQRLDDLRAWGAFIEADERSFVGGYSGLILRLADGKRFSEPVDRVPGGLEGLVEIVPAWAGQLKVSTWDTDPESPDYGRPTMFTFHEAAVAETGSTSNARQRQFMVHPDRVIIWSQDGTVHAASDLEAGYNDLIDIEKIKGAGGEGFWKSAKGSLVLTMDKAAHLADMAKSMGVEQVALSEALNEQVGDFQKGFDKAFLAQGMNVDALSISLPQPEQFFNISANNFAASVVTPIRELIGNQTGERATTEDQKNFSKACMARRQRVEMPSFREFLNRLVQFDILPKRDWTIHWDSLLSASPEEAMQRAKNMAEINKIGEDPLGDGGVTFMNDEIRGEAGFVPFDEVGAN